MKTLEEIERWGAAQHRGNVLASHPAAPGSIPRIPEIIDIAEVNKRCWLEESGQWLENVARAHLVPASGKPVLQKEIN